MGKPILLLGAGASIDAGIQDSETLTELVYERLKSKGYEPQVFGYVAAKLLVRKARKGGSPFTKVNVEEVYDLLRRYLLRETDALGEFVSGWEPVPRSGRSFLAQTSAQRRLARSISIERRSLSHDASFRFDTQQFVESLRAILDLDTDSVRDPESYLRRCVDELSEILSPVGPDLSYLVKLVESVGNEVECIASLNYDLMLERSIDRARMQYDYGLTKWNEKREIRFVPSSIKLLKMHGSLNWFFKGHDNIEVLSDNYSYRNRAMIFGGQSEKLQPNGPFIPLRSEFQRLLNSTNILAIAGYSFQDLHLNALLRSWLIIKRKAKLILVDPAGSDRAASIFRDDASVSITDRVEVVMLESGLRDATPQLIRELRLPPRLIQSKRSKTA